jgi:hypothetical protein
VKTQGLLKLNGSAEPWISDPTAEGAVDQAVGAVHKSTVDRPLNAKGYAIPSVHRRSHGSGRVQARWRRRARRRQGRRGGASPEVRRRTLDRCTVRHFARAWALRVAGEHASKPRRSGGRRGHPQRPTPEGGGSASLASPWRGYSAQGKEK